MHDGRKDAHFEHVDVEPIEQPDRSEGPQHEYHVDVDPRYHHLTSNPIQFHSWTTNIRHFRGSIRQTDTNRRKEIKRRKRVSPDNSNKPLQCRISRLRSMRWRPALCAAKALLMTALPETCLFVAQTSDWIDIMTQHKRRSQPDMHENRRTQKEQRGASMSI